MSARVLATKSTVYTLKCLRHTHHLVCATLLYRLYTATLVTAPGKCKCSDGGGGIASYAERIDTTGR